MPGIRRPVIISQQKALLPSSSSSSSSPRTSTMPSTSTSTSTTRRKDRVNFLSSTPIASFSRPLTDLEHASLLLFEDHALTCSRCHNPYAVYRRRSHLCSEGHALAQDVTHFTKFSHEHAGVLSTLPADHNRPVRLEVPRTYIQALQLLKAVERNSRSTSSRPPFVRRDTARSLSPSPSRRSVSPQPRKRGRRHGNFEIVEWPATELPSLPALLPPSSSPTLALTHTKQTKYHTQVREPSWVTKQPEREIEVAPRRGREGREGKRVAVERYHR